MAAAVNVKGASLEVANAETLFEVHPANPPSYHYDVTSNGKRFLVDSTMGAPRPSLSWLTGLRA